MYVRERSPREETFSRRRRNPSFSSSLLDSIYRSIDESSGGDGDQGYVRDSSTMVKKQSCSAKGGKEKVNLRRAIMIEKWVEKQNVHSSMFSNSASSSSESSSGAAFSSSETDSSCRSRTKPKAVEGRFVQFEEKEKSESGGGGGFSKTKLRALKIYGELKKVKQPISPGGRIASFINSIFNSGNVKKAKMCHVGAVEDVSITEHVSNSKSSCSSSSAPASTFSRSCLSKPSSRAKKSSNGTKRTVRFYPTSMVLGEDSQLSTHHKCVFEEDPSLMPKPSFQKYARSCPGNYDTLIQSGESRTQDLVTFNCTTKSTSYRKTCAVSPTSYRTTGAVGPTFVRSFCDNADDEGSDHDAESCSSSDLFELNHPVGVGRYMEELPVYETTNFRTNQAIAQGFL
ncbi:hypothetical protein ACFX2I_026562 [Malus domestica]|uniref:protein BIG GRAIN 1-like C n=1 Tax=Malus domestica TaxID=3750 RepID=UPI0010A9F22E|nr:protein BIG GRAIN 1-like C [Malus domestica]